MKAQMEYNLGLRQIAAETELSREQMGAEMELAEWQATQNVRLKEREIASRPAKTNGSVGNGGVRFGGAVG